MASRVVIGVTERGKPMLFYNSYEYITKKQLKNGDTVWRCSKCKNLRCKATMITRGDLVVKNGESLHNHEGNIDKSRAKQSVAKMKATINQTGSAPAVAMATVVNNLSGSIQMALPDKR